jgi:hypothetical protein
MDRGSPLPSLLFERPATGTVGEAPGVPSARVPRVRIKALRWLRFERTAPEPAGVLPVANISVTGIALLRDAAPVWPGPGGRIDGALVVVGVACPLQLRVAHVTHDLVSCSFPTQTDALIAVVQWAFHVQLATLAMTHVPPDELAPDRDGVPHWYHGEHGADLYLVERDGRVVRFCLAFLANYLEGGQGRPVRFGVLTRARSLAGDERDSVRWLDIVNAEQLTATIRFIRAIPSLPPRHRDGILNYIY